MNQEKHLHELKYKARRIRSGFNRNSATYWFYKGLEIGLWKAIDVSRELKAQQNVKLLTK